MILTVLGVLLIIVLFKLVTVFFDWLDNLVESKNLFRREKGDNENENGNE